MSAASPSHPNQVRRNVAVAPSRPRQPQAHPQAHLQAQPHVPVHQSAHPSRVSRPRDEQEFRLNLSDIPAMPDSLDVEGFKPSLLSRLFDLVAPLKKR